MSNPHGRAVSLFSKQGAPSQRGIPSGAEGQRIERWRGCPRPSLSKRAPFLSVNPPMDTAGIAVLQPTAPPARFERASSGVGDRCASSRATGAVGPNRSRATTRSRPRDLSRTRAALFPLSYGGAWPRRLDSNQWPLPSEGSALVRLSYDEMAPRPGLEPGTGDS